MRDTKIVNLYGGPGTGKSTTAYLLAGRLKRDGVSCELVTEYAKDVVWADDLNKLDNQIYVFAKQRRRIVNLLGKVDYIITDSPLLLSLIYGAGESQQFKDLVLHEYYKMGNIDIFLQRCKAYDPNGRLQTEEEAHVKDKEILDLLEVYGPSCGWCTFKANHTAANRIQDYLNSGRESV